MKKKYFRPTLYAEQFEKNDILLSSDEADNVSKGFDDFKDFDFNEMAWDLWKLL